MNELEEYAQNKTKVRVLANGPSLNQFLEDNKGNSNLNDFDYIVMNYMPMHEDFELYKPKFLCLADPMFFQFSHRIDEVRKLFKVLNSIVHWEMIIVIPHNRIKEFQNFNYIHNPNLKVKPINSYTYAGLAKFRNSAYNLNFSMPGIYTVANLAIFTAINMNYKYIEVYGIDHNFFDSMFVTDDNVLCNRMKHFYSNEVSLMPILRNDNGKNYKIADYTQSISNMFKSHDLLSSYAAFKNIEILNCSKDSMVDSYKKRIV